MEYQNSNFLMRQSIFWKYNHSAQAESGVSAYLINFYYEKTCLSVFQ